MKIIPKYVLREHAGPLTFALTALTSLLLLNYIAKNFGQLVGKGLPWRVIAAFFVLSLPFTVAMTLPMAVLIATLYAFSRLAAENEITALRASGVGMTRLIVPVVLASAVLSLFMVYFNDQVLPSSNHQLSTLQSDIARKKPTFGLRAQVINEVSPGQFYIRANHLDEFSNRMRDVTIYDLSDAIRRRTIVADSGTMEMAPNGRDLQMTLHHGYMQEVPRTDPLEVQRLYYVRDVIRVPNVANKFESDTAGAAKSDREMTVCELQEQVSNGERDMATARRDLAATLVALTHEATTGAPVQNTLVLPAPSVGIALPSPKSAGGRPVRVQNKYDTGEVYCNFLDRAEALLQRFRVSSLHAEEVPSTTRGQATGRQDTSARAARKQAATPQDSARQGAPQPAAAQRPAVATPGNVIPQQQVVPAPNTPMPGGADKAPASAIATSRPIGVGVPGGLINASAAIESARAKMVEGQRLLNENSVEVHKKFALSAACMIFVLLGAPIALRYPRGGVGFVIGVSLMVFAIYYVGLIGGEPLGDRGMLPPFLAMWLPNMILLFVAIILLSRMGQDAGSSRGGDSAETFAKLRAAIARPFRRRVRAAGTRAA